MRQEETKNAPLRVDICVCTYRRPQLADTLRSLGAMTMPPGTAARVLVADNDRQPSARELVYALAAELPFDVVYVHCPAANISIARNACLDHAVADLVAFIDDDSAVSPLWLAQLLAMAEKSGADAVLGPVLAVYGDEAPDWMRLGDFHSTLPVMENGAIRSGYTGNVLLRYRSPCLAGRRFNLALGQTGGEDTEYFSQLSRNGGRIAFAAKAIAYEPVPQDRARLAWLLKRKFRSGQTHGRLLGEVNAGSGIALQIGLAAAKAAYSWLATIARIAQPEARYRSLLRGVMHAGVMSGLLGLREIRQYGGASTQRHGNAA